MRDEQPWLECQNCGELLRRLTIQEKVRISFEPYEFIAFCRECKKDEIKRLEEESYGYR